MPPTDKPPHFLPAVGRHTEVLEGENKDGRVTVRRPSITETPDVKKPKLEPSESSDVVMKQDSHPNNVSPGCSIPATEDEESLDVEIPRLQQADSPSFATQAAEIPGFKNLGTCPQLVDLTEQDKHLDADNDELQGAVTRTPDVGAGLLRHLNQPPASDPAFPNLVFASNSHAGGSNSHAGASNSLAGGLINNSLHAAAAAAAPASAMPCYQHAPSEMPPWLSDIYSGLQSLHSKADRQYAEIHQGLQTQSLRLTQVESVSAEHTDLHQQTARKLKTLEEKIRELENQKDASRSPKQFQGAPRSPRSPRSPRNSHFGFDHDDEPDLDLVIGGWVDARRDDAIEETKNILRDCQLLDHIDEVWAPYSRTSFVKLRVSFEKETSLALKRRKQTSILEKIKSKRYVSGVAGSENIKLWATRSKSPEERRMTRAIVLCKQFYAHLPHKDPSQANPFPEHSIDISWNGKVFVGQHQLLGSIHRDGEPGINDLLLSDARGNHLEWYLMARVFAKVTGRAEEDLQSCWDQYRPSERE